MKLLQLARPLRWALLGLVLAACGTSLPFMGEDAGEPSGPDAATTTTPTQPPPPSDARPSEPDGGPVADGGQDAMVACVMTQDGSVVSGCMALEARFMAQWNKVADAGCGPDASTFVSTQDPNVLCCAWNERVEVKDVQVPVSFDLDGGVLIVNGREFLPLGQDAGFQERYQQTVPYREYGIQTADAAISILERADASTDGAAAFFAEWQNQGAFRSGTGLNSTTSVSIRRDGGVSMLSSREPHLRNPGAVCPNSIGNFRFEGSSTTPTTIFGDAGTD